MNYKITKQEKNETTISVELTAEEWQNKINASYEKNKNKYTVQGFRKGKAPRKAIEGAYGEHVFTEGALDSVYDDCFTEILAKEKLEPIEQPKLAIDAMNENGLKLTLIVTGKPEVKLGEYKGLKFEKVAAKFDESQVDETLQNLAQRSARKVDVTDRTLQEGDIATFDFSGSMNGEKFEGGTSENFELKIGSHQFIDGFEDQMVGMAIGEEKDLNVTFPDNYHSAELAGKPAVFAVKLHKIQVEEIPELNDEWAANSSEFETLEDYKADIRKHLMEDAEKRAEYETNNKILDQIINSSEVEIPHSMCHSETEYLIKSFQQRLAQQGVDLESYLKYIGQSYEEFASAKHEEAHVNVKARLVIETIIEKENIKVEPAEVDAKLEEIAKQYNKTVEEMKKLLPQDQIMYLVNDILMNKLLDFLKSNNTIA